MTEEEILQAALDDMIEEGICEEGTQLHEISKEVLQSYYKKSATQIMPLGMKRQRAEKQKTRKIRSGEKLTNRVDKKGNPIKDYRPKDALSDAEDRLLNKRQKGMSRSQVRLSMINKDGVYKGNYTGRKTTRKESKSFQSFRDSAKKNSTLTEGTFDANQVIYEDIFDKLDLISEMLEVCQENEVKYHEMLDNPGNGPIPSKYKFQYNLRSIESKLNDVIDSINMSNKDILDDDSSNTYESLDIEGLLEDVINKDMLIEEKMEAGTIKLKDGSEVKLSSTDARLLDNFMNELSTKNRIKLMVQMEKSKKDFKEILALAKEA